MKIIIADDHALVRNALTFMLNAQPDMEVVGDAADGNEVFMKLENTQADLVLMDISMPPGENGLHTTRRIKETHPEIKVIVLTMHDEESYVREALNAGADGFILKSTTDDILLEVIRPRVEQGLKFLILLTKSDKLNRSEGARALSIARLQAGGGEVKLFSALNRNGLEETAQLLWQWAHPQGAPTHD